MSTIAIIKNGFYGSFAPRSSAPKDNDADEVLIGNREHKNNNSINKNNQNDENDLEQLLHDSRNGGEDACTSNNDKGDENGTATIASEVVNIMKNMIGCGVLSMSGGIAQFADDPGYAVTLTSGLWILFFGTVFGYFCVVIAKVCNMTSSRSYRECWESALGGSGRGGLAISVTNTLLPALASLGYATVMSQTLQSVLRYFDVQWSRILCLWVIVLCLLPLCLMRKITALAPTSCLGVISMVLVTILMVVRYADGSYQPGGQFFADNEASLQPQFGTTNNQWSVSAIPFVCMVFQGWVMHFNAPRFYIELKDKSILRFSITVGLAFGLTGIVYTAIALAGFLTFGGHSDTYILNNYSPYDPLATASRVAVFVSVFLAFPILLIGTRDGCLDMIQLPEYKASRSTVSLASVAVLLTLTILACFVTDLGFINVIGGGLFSTLIVFVFPSIMFRQAVLSNAGGGLVDEFSPPLNPRREVQFVMLLSSLGVMVGVVGVWKACVT